MDDRSVIPRALTDLVTAARLGAAVTLSGEASRVTVTSVTSDSAKSGAGTLFCCIPGSLRDGHEFAASAVAAGATALVVSRPVEIDVPQVMVAKGAERETMAKLAAAFWGHPAERLTMIGVTGTNGKTTVTHMVSAILTASGRATSVIGTLSGGLTTPEAPEIQAKLASALEDGKAAVAMEVSSHGLAAHRVDGMVFDVAVFTNLGHDHLDFHTSMEEYFTTKSALFDPEHARTGVVGTDGEWGRRLVDSARIPVHSFGMRDASDLILGRQGSRFVFEGYPAHIGMTGRMNVANALAALRTATVVGIDAGEAVGGLQEFPGVPGRLERVVATDALTVFVDFAHTPEALAGSLDALRETDPAGHLAVVFGCGGERDRSKRPEMGEIAAGRADRVVVTSDNPRSEDPDAIIAEIISGIPSSARVNVMVEADRERAIGIAIGDCPLGGTVLIAGKGHETGQEIAGRKIAFDDCSVAKRLVAERPRTEQ